MNIFNDIRNDFSDIRNDLSDITSNLINIDDGVKLVNNHLLIIQETINKNTQIYKEIENNI